MTFSDCEFAREETGNSDMQWIINDCLASVQPCIFFLLSKRRNFVSQCHCKRCYDLQSYSRGWKTDLLRSTPTWSRTPLNFKFPSPEVRKIYLFSAAILLSLSDKLVSNPSRQFTHAATTVVQKLKNRNYYALSALTEQWDTKIFAP